MLCQGQGHAALGQRIDGVWRAGQPPTRVDPRCAAPNQPHVPATVCRMQCSAASVRQSVPSPKKRKKKYTHVATHLLNRHPRPQCRFFLPNATCCSSGGVLAPAGTAAPLVLACTEAVTIAPSCIAVWGPDAASAQPLDAVPGAFRAVHQFRVQWDVSGPQYRACANISIPLRCVASMHCILLFTRHAGSDLTARCSCKSRVCGTAWCTGRYPKPRHPSGWWRG